MTPQQIELVKSSWALVLPIRVEAAALLYERLFTLDPQLKPLFKRDITQQGAMLMATLHSVVNSLDRLDQVLPTAQQLAVRHVGYGVQPAHYDTVGEALLWTLRAGLGAAATDALMAAWAQAYTTLAAAMKDAAWPPAAALPAVTGQVAAPAQSPAAEWQAQALGRVPA